MSKVKKAVKANPVTTVSGAGGAIALVGAWLGWDADTIAAVTSATIAVALAVRGLVAWWEARNAEA